MAFAGFCYLYRSKSNSTYFIKIKIIKKIGIEIIWLSILETYVIDIWVIPQPY